MAVRADKGALREALERAVRIADRGEEIPALWIQRTEHIGDSPSQTMVAFLGNALLARATFGEAIDPRAIKVRAGERGYSVRGTVSVLVEGKRMFGYGLGVEELEPLNNQPFLRPARVDEIGLDTVRSGAREYLRALKGFLRDIDSLTATEAEHALAAFIIVRRRVAETDRARAVEELRTKKVPLPKLAHVVTAFVGDRPESGRRGQALSAAILDCWLPRVELGGIHDPDAFDVVAFRDKEESVPFQAVQVKQKVVGEDTAVGLAEAAAMAGVPTGLLVAIAQGQPPIDEAAVAARAKSTGVGVRAVTSVSALLRAVAIYGAKTPHEIAETLPAAFEDRMIEIGCEEDAVEHWRELVTELDQD
jgi:hypothetical protein